MSRMLFRPPLNIPGTSIRPPDGSGGEKCPHCKRVIQRPKKKTNPVTKKVVLVCPYCNEEL